mgnify:CR=1 FL=1
MAQAGDTIIYTAPSSIETDEPYIEDISGIDQIIIDYLYGTGGESSPEFSGGAGGSVENAIFDVSNVSTIHIWPPRAGIAPTGRYTAENSPTIDVGEGGGSTEVYIDDGTDGFIAGAGGGGGGAKSGFFGAPGTDGARGGDAEGIPPPEGGRGQSASSGTDGYGAIGSQVPVVDSGTTKRGGGSSSDTNAEIQITYESLAPDAPTNASITDTQTQGELAVDWDTVSGATGYYVYRAQSSGSSPSDYTQVADVTSPPYTDTGLEDGERYFYRVGATNSEGDSDLSNEIDAVTVLPAASNASASANNGNVDLSWTNNDSSSDGGIRIDVSTDGGSTYNELASGLAPNTSTYTHTSSSYGNTYTYRVVRITDHATATSGTATIQTPLPITVDGVQVIDITVNGNSVTGLTIDGTTIF